jgi:glycosyltransferase involved in cell wall biosynthesis
VSGVSSYRILKEIRPDLLHLHRFNALSLSLIRSAVKLDIPVVFSMYDYWYVCPTSALVNGNNDMCRHFQGAGCADCYHYKNPLVEGVRNIASGLGLLPGAFRMRKMVFDRYLKKIDALVVLSDSWGEMIRRYGANGQTISAIPLPLFEGIGKPDGGHVEAGSMLFVGWVYPHKGLHVLIEAMPQIIRAVPEARLYVVESGVLDSYKDGIMKSIAENGITEHVVFLGKRSNEEVQALLNKARVVVVPEQWAIAWPIFLTEAMACGKLIVASRIGDIPQFIKDGETGLLAEPDQPSDFAGQVIRMFQDGDTAAMGEKARQKILRLCNEDRILERLMDVYTLVLRCGSR